MSKISRKTSKLFASTAGGSDIGVFGSLAAGSPAYSTDPAVIQSLSNFLTGWAAETIATRRPAYQDFNALDFLTFYQLGYLFQAGVAEWDAGTTYFAGSICTGVVTGVLYQSLVDDNLNNAVTDPTKWGKMLGTAAPLDVGTTANKIVQLDGSAKLPAVDGSLLTGVLKTQVGFGAWTTLTNNQSYLAATDGICVCLFSGGGNGYVYSDASTPPTTTRAACWANSGATGCCAPVRKGDYYKAANANSAAYFISLGA